MVAGPWGWGFTHMLTNFGWKALVGIVTATALYGVFFRKELRSLAAQTRTGPLEADGGNAPVPAWVVAVHLGFLGWTVWAAHYPVLFIGGFLFFVAFMQATAHHQTKLDLRGPVLVGFFLAGLVIHGGLQGWWIAPVLSGLAPTELFWGAPLLTAFTDNAAITYLATLVPGFSDAAKYAVVAGAVAGGGLTVIATAPNPAGLSILQRYFPEGFSPVKLALAALLPTLVMAGCFLLL
jgi:Na+/H+ antiporter NhaD/arsenite permease-like protein